MALATRALSSTLGNGQAQPRPNYVFAKKTTEINRENVGNRPLKIMEDNHISELTRMSEEDYIKLAVSDYQERKIRVIKNSKYRKP